MNDARERLLVHWVNSLPITSCLLVRELPDLRFGDILSEIVRWLNTQDRDVRTLDSPISATLGDVRKRVHKVVDFVARECCTRDEDAMYVVNQTNCVERIMSGDHEAIGSVLMILKRLVAYKQQKQTELKRTQEQAMQQSFVIVCTAAVDRQMALSASKPPPVLSRPTTSACRKKSSPRSSSRPSNAAEISPERVRRQKAERTSQKKEKENVQTQPKKLIRKRREQIPSKTQQHDLLAEQSTAVDKSKLSAKPLPAGPQTTVLPTTNNVFYDERGLHVFGMIDPRAKITRDSPKAGGSDRKPLRRPLNARCAAIINAVAVWISTLGISLSPNPPQLQESYALFSDGILLSQVAAAVIRRHGSLDAQSCLQEGPVGVWILPNTTLYPQSDGQRRNNLEAALRVLHAYASMSNKDSEDSWSVEKLTSQPANVQAEMKVSEKIWMVLDLIRKSAKQGPMSPQRNSTGESIRGPAAIQPVPAALILEQQSADAVVGQRKRPFITSEQILAVDQWIHDLGWNVDEVSSLFQTIAGSLLLTDELHFPQQKCRGVLQNVIRNGVLLWYSEPFFIVEGREPT